jgi:hypothetical protein
MVYSTTLVSLAMLKVKIDEGKDYLEYLRPFILQTIHDHMPSRITDISIKDLILKDYGLEIPQRTVQIMLKRISRTGCISKEQGIYIIKRKPTNPGVQIEKTNAERHIRAVCLGLIDFRLKETGISIKEDEAILALCDFLSKHSIPCLKAYLHGSTIPEIKEKKHQTLCWLVNM